MPQITPGAWKLDPQATSITFSAPMFLGLKAKGSFSRWESSVQVGDSAAESSVTVTLWTDSLGTGIKMRDGHLLSDTAFSAKEFPTMEFHSTSIAETADGLDISGSLRIRDVTKPVSFHAVHDTSGGLRYTATLKIAGGDHGFSRSGTTKPVDVLIDASLIKA